MKLVNYNTDKGIHAGIVVQDKLFSLAPFFLKIDSEFITNNSIEYLKREIDLNVLKEVKEPYQLTTPILNPSKIVCIGLNYGKHIAETHDSTPKYPIFFIKSNTALCGPYDSILIPPECKSVDWEVELAVIIGKRTQRVKKEHAMEYIAGYSIMNDVSEREFQLKRGAQWTPGKCFDHFAPLGPYLVTTDTITNPNNLTLWTRINGHEMQYDTTANMLFSIPELIEYISHCMTLLPGDIISTGTPSGVAMGRIDKPYLKPGDVVEQGIDCIGVTCQHCIELPY